MATPTPKPKNERTIEPGDASTPVDVAHANQAENAAVSEVQQGATAESAKQTQPMAPVDWATPEDMKQHAPEQLPADQNPLFGPTENPNEPMTVGMGTASAKANVSANTLSALQMAAQDPEAPVSLKNLLALLTYHASQE